MISGGKKVHLKLGDRVMKKNGEGKLVFQITGFEGEQVFLQGVAIPIITIVSRDDLIKLNNKRCFSALILKRVK